MEKNKDQKINKMFGKLQGALSAASTIYGATTKQLVLLSLMCADAEKRMNALATWADLTDNIDPAIKEAINNQKSKFDHLLTNELFAALENALAESFELILWDKLKGLVIAKLGPAAPFVWLASFFGDLIYNAEVQPVQLACLAATLQQSLDKTGQWQLLNNKLSPATIESVSYTHLTLPTKRIV